MDTNIKEIERKERQYYEKFTGNKASEMIKNGELKTSENYDERFMLLSEEGYARMKEYINPILMEIAKEQAKSIVRKHKDRIGDKLEAIKLVLATMTSVSGLGVFHLSEINEKDSYTVHIYNSFEAHVAKKYPNLVKSHSCPFSMGFIKGLFEAIFERKVKIEETTCKSEEECCEIKIALL